MHKLYVGPSGKDTRDTGDSEPVEPKPKKGGKSRNASHLTKTRNGSSRNRTCAPKICLGR